MTNRLSAWNSKPTVTSRISHKIVFELRPPPEEFGSALPPLVAQLSPNFDCTHYGRTRCKKDKSIWVIEGLWDCTKTMERHFSSPALHALINYLKSMSVYCAEFSAEGI
ncbi:hypothetical protein KRR23_11435 [Pseudomonas sp. CVAP|uniref:hypothetical protein n=1 Tax=Pseudomonas sp. CVAP\|nr:hypothetical protein [Pseudomonas sp. CVAP\